MCPPPKPPKPTAPPPPVEAPELELGSENANQKTRTLKRRGRNQLRSGLSIPTANRGLTTPSI